MSREYDLACFKNSFPVLNQHIVYEFEPCDNDQILQVIAVARTETTKLVFLLITSFNMCRAWENP